METIHRIIVHHADGTISIATINGGVFMSELVARAGDRVEVVEWIKCGEAHPYQDVYHPEGHYRNLVKVS